MTRDDRTLTDALLILPGLEQVGGAGVAWSWSMAAVRKAAAAREESRSA